MVYVLCFIRWRLLLQSIGIRPRFNRLLISYLGGAFFNTLLPSTIGGDLVKIIDLNIHTRDLRKITASVVVDRLVGFIALGIVTFIAIFIGYSYIDEFQIFIPVLILLSCIFLLVVILFSRGIFSKLKVLIPTTILKKKIESLHSEIFYFRTRYKVMFKSLIISLIAQVFIILSFYYIFYALHLKLNLIYFFIFIPLITTIATIPLSIAGLGLRDIGAVFFFVKIGVDKSVAVSASLLSFFFIMLIGFICGVIYVSTLHNRWLQRN
jgi:hypothetical protein